MNTNRTLNEMICDIHGMERDQCIDELMHFQAMRLDFTPNYLEAMSTERLRHVLVAAVLTARTRKSA